MDRVILEMDKLLRLITSHRQYFRLVILIWLIIIDELLSRFALSNFFSSGVPLQVVLYGICI